MLQVSYFYRGEVYEMSVQLIILNRVIARLAIDYPKLDSMDLLIKAREEIETNNDKGGG